MAVLEQLVADARDLQVGLVDPATAKIRSKINSAFETSDGGTSPYVGWMWSPDSAGWPVKVPSLLAICEVGSLAGEGKRPSGGPRERARDRSRPKQRPRRDRSKGAHLLELVKRQLPSLIPEEQDIPVRD